MAKTSREGLVGEKALGGVPVLVVRILEESLGVVVQRFEERGMKNQEELRYFDPEATIYAELCYLILWNTHTVIELIISTAISIRRQTSTIGSDGRSGCLRWWWAIALRAKRPHEVVSF